MLLELFPFFSPFPRCIHGRRRYKRWNYSSLFAVAPFFACVGGNIERFTICSALIRDEDLQGVLLEKKKPIRVINIIISAILNFLLFHEASDTEN